MSEAMLEPKELPASAKENLEVLAAFQEREDAQTSGLQLFIERVSLIVGSPAYFVLSSLFIVVWALINWWGVHAGWRHVDGPPFPWLQGLVSANSLLVTVAVLIRQNRAALLAQHHSHLDLQINLLTEQKVTKILQIVDELQRELTELRRRPDDKVAELTQPADAHALMHAIKKQGES